MLRDLSRRNASGAGICGTHLSGVTAGEMPSGFSLPGLLNNDVDAGDPAGCLYSEELVDWPTAGVFAAEETGAFSFTGAPDGTYTGATIVRKNGVASSGTYSFVIGAAVVDPPPDPEPVVRTVSVACGDSTGPAANLTGVKVSFAAGTGPHDAGPYLYQSSTETLDANGVVSFTMAENVIASGASGVLCVLLPDGRRMLRIVTVA